jgi:hypothetical protein
MVMTVKIILCWDATPPTLLGTYHRFGESYCIFEDGESRLPRNFGKYLIDCTLSHPQEDSLVYFSFYSYSFTPDFLVNRITTRNNIIIACFRI